MEIFGITGLVIGLLAFTFSLSAMAKAKKLEQEVEKLKTDLERPAP